LNVLRSNFSSSGRYGHFLEPDDKYCRQCGAYAGSILEKTG
jgi:hypothetical protein